MNDEPKISDDLVNESSKQTNKRKVRNKIRKFYAYNVYMYLYVEYNERVSESGKENSNLISE